MIKSVSTRLGSNRTFRRWLVLPITSAVLLVALPVVWLGIGAVNYFQVIHRGPTQVAFDWAASLDRSSIGDGQEQLDEAEASECDGAAPSARELHNQLDALVADVGGRSWRLSFRPDTWDSSSATPFRDAVRVEADVDVSVDGIPGNYGGEDTYSATRRWTVNVSTGPVGLYWLVCGVDTHGELWPTR